MGSDNEYEHQAEWRDKAEIIQDSDEHVFAFMDEKFLSVYFGHPFYKDPRLFGEIIPKEQEKQTKQDKQ